MKWLTFFGGCLLFFLSLSGCTPGGHIPTQGNIPFSGGVIPGHMAVIWYEWPSTPGGFSSFDVQLTIEADPGVATYYYWAHQFRFKNGDGAYMGLQTNGYIPDYGWVGKMAIFSVWNALSAEPAPGVSKAYFTGEGEGWSLRKRYNWVAGRTYILRVQEAGFDGAGNRFWGAWIIDTGTGEETFLGRIKVPSSWQGLESESSVWVEYFREVSGCNAIPYARARFEKPRANGGMYTPLSLKSGGGSQTCPESGQITLTGNQGVIFETGKK